MSGRTHDKYPKVSNRFLTKKAEIDFGIGPLEPISQERVDHLKEITDGVDIDLDEPLPDEMNNEHYLFSAMVLKQFSKTELPKWWEFWKQLKQIKQEGWEKVAISLTKPEGDALLALDDFAPMRTAFLKAIAQSGNATVHSVSLVRTTNINPLDE